MKKTVAIIGAAGDIGSAIALGLAAAGYRVLLTDDIEHHSLLYIKLPLRERKIRLKVPEADVDIVLSAREASWEADIIILAIPCETQAETACKIKDVVTGKVVISLTNPLNETQNASITAPTKSATEELAQLLPHAKIVHAFSTIVVGEPRLADMGVVVLVAGHDEEAMSTVMQLAKDVGYIVVASIKTNERSTCMGTMRKAMLSGLGALSLTREKAGEIVDELVKRGEMSEKDRTAMIDKLLKEVEMQKDELQGKVTSSVRKVLTDIGLPTQKDLKSVLRRLDGIGKAIGETNRDTQGTKS